MMCIGNAIATLLAQKELPEAKYLILNTDSTAAIHHIEKATDALGTEIYALLQKLKKKINAEVTEFRHVKAHSGKRNARSAVNRWCDQEAKRWMRSQL